MPLWTHFCKLLLLLFLFSPLFPSPRSPSSLPCGPWPLLLCPNACSPSFRTLTSPAMSSWSPAARFACVLPVARFPSRCLSVRLRPQDTSVTTWGLRRSTMATLRRRCSKGHPRSLCMLRLCAESLDPRPLAQHRRPPLAQSWLLLLAATSTATRRSAKATRPTPSSSLTGVHAVRLLMLTLLRPPPQPRWLPPTATLEVVAGRAREALDQGRLVGAARAWGWALRRVPGQELRALVAGTRAASAAKLTPRRRT